MSGLDTTLQGAFSGSGGGGAFDLLAAFGGLATATGAVPTTGFTLDSSAISQASSSLSGADLGGVHGAAGSVATAGTAQLAQVPDGGQLLAPLRTILDRADQLGGDQGVQLLQALRNAGAAGADRGVGMGGLAAPLAALAGARSDPSVASVLQLASRLLPGGFNLGTVIQRFIDPAVAVRNLVQLLGGLMASHGAVADMLEGATTTARFLRRTDGDPVLARLRGIAAGADLAALVTGVTDPDDSDAVDAALAPVLAFLADTRRLADLMQQGMASAEATLVHADLAGRATDFDAAGALLLSVSPDPIRAAALDLQARVSPLIPASLGPPAASLEALWNDATGLVAGVTSAIAGLPTASVTRPVTDALGRVTSVIHTIDEVVHQVTGAIRAAFETARQIVASLDIPQIVEAIRRFLQPLVDAIQLLDRLIGDAIGALTAAIAAIQGPLDLLKTAFTNTAADISGAFTAVKTAFEGLHLTELVDNLRAGIESTVDELHKVQLRPYFDQAAQVMNTALSVVGALPLNLLPDDAKQKINDAVQPIETIDYDHAVRDVLEQQMHDILADFDTEVLGAVAAAYQQVVTFLEGIDPAGKIADFERDHFDPMLQNIASIDPNQLLQPVTDALAAIRQQVAAIDIREQVLGPVEHVFDQLLAGFDQLQPGPLIAPLEAQVGALRDRIVALTHIDKWAAGVDELAGKVSGLLDRIDLDALIPRLETAYQTMLASVADPNDQGNVVGSLAAALMEGAGFRVRPASFQAAARWLGGADAAAELHAMLGDAHAALDAAGAAARAYDPQELATLLGPVCSAIAAAAAARPDGCYLRLRLDPALALAAPLERFATQIDNRTRYLGVLDAAVSVVTRLEGSGMSQVNAAAQGLRDALRPLAAMRDRAVGLVARFGIQPVGLTVRGLFGQLFDFFRPSRALEPLRPLVAAFKAKIQALLVDGLVTPVKAGIAELTDLVNAIDISFIRTELEGLHAQIRADLNGFRPSVLLADALGAIDALKAHLLTYDPAAAIRGALDHLKETVEEVVNAFRPSVLLRPVLEVYQEILDLAHHLDVHALLQPVLAELQDLESQLEAGIDDTGSVFKHLQQVLGSIGGGSGGSAGGEVEVGASA